MKMDLFIMSIDTCNIKILKLIIYYYYDKILSSLQI